MRFVKLTNLAEAFKGDNIYINPKWIISVYSLPSQDMGSLKTIVYGGPTGLTWEVEESPEEIIKLIERCLAID